MTSKERICKILNFDVPDRIGIHDTFLETTLNAWKTNGLPENLLPEDYFGFDIKLIDIDDIFFPLKTQDKEKFLCISFPEPFQSLCDAYTTQETLKRIASDPEGIKAELALRADNMLDRLEKIIDKEHMKFDGAWVWGDAAYNEGLYFSMPFYKETLLPLHKKIFSFLNSRGLPVFFHSDGNITELIPYLLDAGVKAIHPLEESSGMDIQELLSKYKKSMVFMGHMDISKLLADRELFRERISMLKSNCSYIYQADYPILPDVSLRDYNAAMDLLREAGSY